MQFRRDKEPRELISLDELRDWNYIEDHCFDAKLRLCLSAAVAAAEAHTNTVIWPSVFSLSLDRVETEIPVSVYPVSSLSIRVDGAELAPGGYSFDGNVIRITATPAGQGMEIVLTAGEYEISEDVKSAILLMASELFRNPTDTVRQLPTASQLLLQPFRRVNV